MHIRRLIIAAVLIVLLCGCRPDTPATGPVLIPTSPSFSRPTATFLPVPTSPSPISMPTSTQTSTPVPVCVDTAPFSLGCLDQTRPVELAPGVNWVGFLPSTSILRADWSPDGNCIAYGAFISAKNETERWVEIRCQPDFQLAGRWQVPGLTSFPFLWTRDGQAVLFIQYPVGSNSSTIGLARLQEVEWQDLLPGERSHLGVSMGKRLVGWRNNTTLAFTQAIGTGLCNLYLLDISQEPLSPPESTGLHATFFLLDPQQNWLVENYRVGFPDAYVREWSNLGQEIRLSSQFGEEYKHGSAEFWVGDSLGVLAYRTWGLKEGFSRPDFYLWNVTNGERQMVASSAFRANASPTGDRLAIDFWGEPHQAGERVEATGEYTYLGLLDWPSGRLLSTYLVEETNISQKGFPMLTDPAWSPDGQWLAFPLAEGMVLMDRSGNTQPVLSGREVKWVGWGSNGYLAMLIDKSIWLVQVPTPGE